MSRDIVLITIDCWRYDAVERMSNLLSLTGHYTRTEAICQAAATNGVFPAILSSMYYPYAYEGCVYPTLKGFGMVKPDVCPLPQVLSENGYSTAAIIGANPFLNKWAKYFDYFWNGGLSGVSTDVVRCNSSLCREIERIHKFIMLKHLVTAAELAKRAKHWYEEQEKPRFLWVHLMEPHDPYLPGLKKGFEEGLLKSYRATFQFMKDRNDCSKEVLDTMQDLYWKSVDKLDEQIHRLLDFVNEDATILIMADHGQAFLHGYHRHARLYDECVRVPLLIRWTMTNPLPPINKSVRQIDLPPTLLKGLNIPIPYSWQGRAMQDGLTLLSPMMNHAPRSQRTYIGIRTEGSKLIRTYNSSTGEEVGMELYDLGKDEEEQNNIYGNAEAEEMERHLEEFLQPLKSASNERERLKKLGQRLKKSGI